MWNKKTVAGAVIFLAVVGASAVEVDINLDVRHEVGGVSELDRETYFVLHASAGENTWDSEAQEGAFLNSNDVYLGRSNGTLPWNLSQTTEDPAKPGWCDPANMLTRGNNARSSYASDTHAQSLEFRANKMMIGGQMNMLYPNGGTNANGFVVTEHDALADFYEQFLTDFYGTGGTDGAPRPAMIEVVNEPFVAATSHGTTREDISRLHTNVAAAIHHSHPDVLVGGYCAAHPQYEGNDGDFSHWDSNWKTFIDIAGTNMDFFSLHLYDNPSGSTNVLDTLYRSGSNIEAILDMIEHYSMLTLGEIKPFNISEFGSLSITNDAPYDPKNDWGDVRSYSTILMQLLERPDRMIQTIPFMMVQAEWGRSDNGYPYPTRLLYDVDELTGSPKDKDGPFDFTQRIKFWQLWNEVRGTRVDTIASDPDIQVDAYVDGTNAFVIVSSLDHTGPQTVDLNLFGSFQPLENIEVKHTYADPAGNVILDQYTTNWLSSITLPASSTAVIKYEFSGAVVPGRTSTENKYYATTYLQPISAGSPINFGITNVNASALYGEAVLRLGIGRAHGLSLQPTLTVNGTTVPVPSDFRGYDQLTRDQFFGVLEIPVPYDLLQSNNTVSVEFGDSGGHVSSVALQVFRFESDIRTRAKMIPIDTLSKSGDQNLILSFFDGPTNSWFELHSKTNLQDPVWTVDQAGLPIDASGFGSVTNPLSASQAFFRIVEGKAPGIPVSGIALYPDSDTVAVGGTCRISYLLVPVDATDQSIIWTSSNPSVATVSGGIVTGVSAGSATITAETSDGGFTDTCAITVGSFSADISFDDANNYKNQTFTNGTFMTVRTTYDAGAGHTVLSSSGGIRYLLRQIDSTGGPWTVVADYEASDGSAIGMQSGGSQADIWLPEDIIPTDYLPANHFYYLFVKFDSSDASAYTVGTKPVIIVDPDAAPVIQFTAPDYSDGDIDNHSDWASFSGPWTVDSTAGTVTCSGANDNMTYLNGTALSVGQTLDVTFRYNVLGIHTPSTWKYVARVGVTTDSSGSNQGYNNAANDPSESFAMFTIQAYGTATNAFRAYGDGWNGPQSSKLDGNDAGDEYAVHYSITLGADAASTPFSVELENVTKATRAGTITETDGIGTALYNALVNGTAYPYFETGGLGDGITGVQVNSVVIDTNP